MKSIIVSDRCVEPSRIVCVGRNYVDHIKELNNDVPDEPVIFFKVNASIGEKLHAAHGEQLHYEGELSFVFENGRFSAVGFGLDLTKRVLQNVLKEKGLPWERAKAFDGSALFSPFVEISDIADDLSLELVIDNHLVQSGGISLMIYKPDVILEKILSFTTLYDGDVVMTGTPKGVGPVNPGCRFVGRVMAGSRCLTGATWIAE